MTLEVLKYLVLGLLNRNVYFIVLLADLQKNFLSKIKKVIFINDFTKLKHENIKHYICSTSWKSNIEMKKNLFYAKKKILILLFTLIIGRIMKRLIYRNKNLLPNEIWVNDIYAFKLIRKYYPHVKLKKKKLLFK